MGFDVSTVELQDTTTVDLLHPVTGEEIGASVTVYGQDSDKYKTEARRCEDQVGKYAQKNRGKMMPSADREAMDRRKIINCVASVDGLLKDKKPWTDVAEILKTDWIYEQVCAAIVDRANFMKGSPAK